MHTQNAVSAQHKLSDYLPFLKTNATYIIVGIPPEPYAIHAGELLMKRLKIGGSIIGGIKECQSMLTFCGQHNITSMIELIPASYANKAMKRLNSNDVKFRFVIDVGGSLSADSPEVEEA
jgi:D-arabinose 1-dehydrogenase-like Zn-dependent alcohol dehydrogenase